MSECEVEVEKLKKEIFQLKADKDFVWSLWKRLQLSSPDLTEAVNLISQREKEKMSDKHQQYEKEIQEKDEKLKNLIKTIECKNQEIENLVKSNNDILHKATQLEKHCVDVTEKALKLDKLIKTVEENGQREIIVSYERERQQLTESVSRLQTQITYLTDEKNRLQLTNVENQEKIKNYEDLQRFVVELRQQLDDANIHINTQQETIEILREQLENRLRYSNEKTSIHDGGYLSDQADVYQGNNQNVPFDDDCESSISPIEDLNYKVDRLSLHMKHLQDCMSTKPGNQFQKFSRSKSTPNRKNFKANLHQNEMSRKIEFLTNKIKKIENTLTEEQKNSTSATQFLDKANKRIKGMQLTIKQLRKQIEDSKEIENESKRQVDQIDSEKEIYKKELRNKELEIQKMNQNSVNDASRIQNLLSKLEEMRDELTEKKIKQEQESNNEIDRLRDIVKNLEIEKCQMESKLIETLPVRCSLKQQNCCHVDKPQKHRFPVGRNKRLKTILSKDRLTKSSKTIKMSSILNHFLENVKDNNKEDEWEDVETDEDEIPTDTTNTCTGRSSVPSTGTRIAKVAALNQCSSRRDMSRSRNKEAEIDHINRMKESKEKSSVLERDYNITKTRIDSLQQQLKGITASRDSYRNKCEVMQTQMKNLHSDFQQAKLRCTRLIEAIKKQSGLYQIMLEERKQYLGVSEAGLPSDNFLKELSFDIDESGSIVQPSVGDAAIYREMQQELIRKNSDLSHVREKLSRLERESACKKKIIDDLRNKLISFESAKDKERISLEIREKKIKELEESNARMKIQIDSLQTRFNVVLDERRRFEQESGNLMMKLEAAENKLSELKQAKQVMESRLSNVDESHEMRIHDIVARSGSALEKASSQINALKARGGKYETLVLNLAKDFHQKIREIRRLIEFGNRRFSNNSTIDKASRSEAIATGKSEESANGYDFARRKAADILKMSTTEIDSLLNGMTATAGGTRRERNQANNSALEDSTEFTSRCRRALKAKSFDQEILSIFADKLEELVDFIAPSSCDSGCVSSC